MNLEASAAATLRFLILDAASLEDLQREIYETDPGEIDFQVNKAGKIVSYEGLRIALVPGKKRMVDVAS